MILCGSLPFLAFSREGLEECVKKDDWKRKNGEWMEISGGARNLIGKMLDVREEERLTAEEALRHEWYGVQSDFIFYFYIKINKLIMLAYIMSVFN